MWPVTTYINTAGHKKNKTPQVAGNRQPCVGGLVSAKVAQTSHSGLGLTSVQYLRSDMLLCCYVNINVNVCCQCMIKYVHVLNKKNTKNWGTK